MEVTDARGYRQDFDSFRSDVVLWIRDEGGPRLGVDAFRTDGPARLSAEEPYAFPDGATAFRLMSGGNNWSGSGGRDAFEISGRFHSDRWRVQVRGRMVRNGNVAELSLAIEAADYDFEGHLGRNWRISYNGPIQRTFNSLVRK